MSENLFDLYMDWLDETESPLVFHRWTLVSTISTILGRDTVFGEGTALQTYPNQYITLVGPPASRKNTAMRYQKQLLQAVGFNNFSSDRTSKEKFIQDMQEGFSESTEDILNLDISGSSEALIYAPELQDFLGMGNMDFISFLTNMWDMPEEYSHRLKNSKSSRLVKPTINLLGGATAQTISEIFPAAVAGQGFLSRALLIYGKGARKKITFPKQPCGETFNILVDALKTIKNRSNCHAILSAEAEQMLDEIYKSWKPIPDSRMETYSGRRFTHLIKLCIVVAAAHLSYSSNGLEITAEHVVYANSMLSFVEGFMPRALGKLGSSRTMELQSKIMGTLEASPDGLNFIELHKRLTSEVENIHALAEAVKLMIKLGQIIPNMATKVFYAGSSGPRKQIHCNFDLLKEGKEYYKDLETGNLREDEENDNDPNLELFS